MFTEWRFVSAAMDVYTEILAMFERNYPETMSKSYVINGTMTILTLVCAVSDAYVVVHYKHRSLRPTTIIVSNL